MKKLMILGAMALFGAVNAQKSGNFELGAHIGLPMGDASDAYSFTLGIDAAYLWNVAPSFDLGIASGYSAFLGKTISYAGYGDYKVPTLSLIPVAATGRYNINGGFNIGLDLGYGFVSSDGSSTGGFYYQPKIGYNLGAGNLYLGYQGVSKDGSTLSSLNLGYAHKF